MLACSSATSATRAGSSSHVTEPCTSTRSRNAPPSSVETETPVARPSTSSSAVSTAAVVKGAKRRTRASSARRGSRSAALRPTSAGATRVSTSSTIDACVSEVNAGTGQASP